MFFLRLLMWGWRNDEVYSVQSMCSSIEETLLKDCYIIKRTSLVAQMVKNLPVMQETQVQSLGQEDPLEKEMATHSSVLAWRIPWTEEPGGVQSVVARVGHD